MSFHNSQKHPLSLFIFFLTTLPTLAFAVNSKKCIQVLSEISPIWIRSSKSPGFQTLRQEGKSEFHQAVGKAINDPNNPQPYQDKKGRLWEIVYKSNPDGNNFNFNVSRVPFSGLNLTNLTATESAKRLEGLARSPAANSPRALAIVREGDVPYYEVNPKHIKGTESFNNARNKKPSVIPPNHIELYRQAIADNKGDYWAIDKNGNLHRFQTDQNWTTHWNGSTQLKKPGKPNSQYTTEENPAPMSWDKIPPEVLKHFGY
ncbi:MAG: hypothetical protein EXR74_03140 [Bdellovibrionales bacterium]|nr:hypothetical protein [Bdellovibrionales bacterium]